MDQGELDERSNLGSLLNSVADNELLSTNDNNS